MSINLPLHRAALNPSSSSVCLLQQIRHATLIRRPKRPYTFTQLITLSDGSTFMHRTTSPQAIYRSTRDTRNAPMWNPSSFKLQNMEEDEAGRLAAFRKRFGRNFDSQTTLTEKDVEHEKTGRESQGKKDEVAQEEEWEDEEEENLLDMITSFGQEEKMPGRTQDVVRSRRRQK